MQEDILIAGFGGQGVLFAGQLMAYAAMDKGFQVTWIPSYGPEMRGGTAHCHVRLSQHSIPSPLINRPMTVIAFNEPSVERFEQEILPGGLFMINSSMVSREIERTDMKVVKVPATEIANSVGNPKVANMVMLGAYLAVTRALEPESILASLSEHGMQPNLLETNRAALDAGQAYVSTS